MANWLAVVSADHVERGRSLGIAQANHGTRSGLARMHAGDTMVFYSPTAVLGSKTPLRSFTAIATLPDDDLWEADEGERKPWRRRAVFESVTPAPLSTVKELLHLTGQPNWGYQLRRGLVPLDDHDTEVLRAHMAGSAPVGSARVGSAPVRSAPVR